MGGTEAFGLDGLSGGPGVPGGECFDSLFGGVVERKAPVEVDGVACRSAAMFDAVALAESFGVGVQVGCGGRFDALQALGGGVELSGDGVELVAELAALPARRGDKFSL